uniref:Serine racemase n=1 Tax=Steinernema glaseri TaxID=37863 RepID=A0A1I7ZN42_9BILA
MFDKLNVEDAQERIRPFVNATPVLTSSYLNDLTGKNLYFKCENFQKTGSFKARGALNAILKARSSGHVTGVIAHSGGNHGQAVAWAAKQIGVPCVVVSPSTTPKTKVDAMRDYGAEMVITEPTMTAMVETSARLAKERGYTFIDPMNDYDVMSGQGTVAKEFLEQVDGLEAVLIATGGGGLASGVAGYVKAQKPACKEQVDHLDAVLIATGGGGLASGVAGYVKAQKPACKDTVADGCRPLAVGDKCFDVLLRSAEHTVFPVTDEEILEAMKLILQRMKLVVEPSAALGLAAILKYKDALKDYHNIGLVLCGGNVDLTQNLGKHE